MWNEALQKVPSSRISQSVCCSRFEFESLFNIASNLVMFAVACDLPDIFFILNTLNSFWLRSPVKKPFAGEQDASFAYRILQPHEEQQQRGQGSGR